MKNILNIAGYRFVSLPLDQLPVWRLAIKNKANDCRLKGTLLLSGEGVNLFLAGAPDHIRAFRDFLAQYPELAAFPCRETWSDVQPFRRLLVRLKKEIISMGHPLIQPEKKQAAYVSPETLQAWYREGRPVLMLDVRNRYEIEYGSFEGAVDLNLKNFRSFPEVSRNVLGDAKEKTIVTFCTGGIRCEKAALWLEENGFKEVYQLQGGILNYLETCGSEYFHGKCFVFDEREAVGTEVFNEHS